jgi:aspartate/methionine/tyrosine aminotransferase
MSRSDINRIVRGIPPTAVGCEACRTAGHHEGISMTAVSTRTSHDLAFFDTTGPDLAAHFTRLMTNSNSCTASFTQIAGVEALTGDQSSVDQMRSEFKARRDVFIAGLNRIKGFSCRMPKGAFYAFPNITKTGWNSRKLADALLQEAGVACLAGPSFGPMGEGYIRFSIANSLENLNQALERINGWVNKNL